MCHLHALALLIPLDEQNYPPCNQHPQMKMGTRRLNVNFVDKLNATIQMMLLQIKTKTNKKKKRSEKFLIGINEEPLPRYKDPGAHISWLGSEGRIEQ